MTLEAQDLTFGYAGRPIGEHVDLTIEEGSFTVIVGPNACGKSTLLRALSRLLKPSGGQVLLDGKLISSLGSKQVARRLGLLPQTALAPEGITVADLVARGRHPYQSALRQWSREDEAAVREALDATGTTDLADRLVEELSGGQRQRVWIAMVLAQQTGLLLLDEPTTFLDIAHQIELMELLTRLNREGRTVVAVLHDLNQAARYGSRIVAMRDGAIVAEGRPADVVTSVTIEQVFDLPCKVIEDPVSGAPLVLPLGGLHG
ncbi:ABC transporter ATP-binding protein [Pimelobacter simplex]|uniref:ABC transporter ATP-binding protein n=1 Tax=Nocardioides simplex TaxID=2045 RepID=UPI00366F2BB4